MSSSTLSGMPSEVSTSLQAAATTLTLTGLNGDLDGDYRIIMDINIAVSSTVIALLVNGSETNLDWFCSNGSVGGTTRTDWKFCQNGSSPTTWSAGDFIQFRGHINARSGRVRSLSTETFYAMKLGSKTAFISSGRYNDSTTNITSFGISANQTNGLASGTYIRFVRSPTSNPLA